MSVTNQDNKITYEIGEELTYDIPFEFQASEHIKTYVDDLLIESGFEVTGAGDPEGGELEFSEIPEGETLTILRDVPLTQENSFNEAGPFAALTIERMFDKLTHIAQQLKEAISRSIRLPISSQSVDPQITGDVVPGALIEVNEIGDGLRMGQSVASYKTELNAIKSQTQAIKEAAAIETTGIKDLAVAAKVASENARDQSVTAKNQSQAAAAESEAFKNAWLGSSHVVVPAGTTAQRPSEPQAAMFRFNTTLGIFEGYRAGAWGEIGGGGYVPIAANPIENDGAISVPVTNKRMAVTVVGNGAPVMTSNAPFGDVANFADGTEIMLIGTSDAQSVVIPFYDEVGGCVGGFSEIELTKYKSAVFVLSSSLSRWILKE